jgi:hypothetical protein
LFSQSIRTGYVSAESLEEDSAFIVAPFFNQSHFISPWRVLNLWCENYKLECAQLVEVFFQTKCCSICFVADVSFGTLDKLVL